MDGQGLRARGAEQSSTDGGYYDNRFQATAVKVLPGEYKVTSDDVMLVTVLGSCVSACIRDPHAGIGGMNHFMLPEGEFSTGVSSARYGGFAMEMLINDLLKRGAARQRLEAKVFGGGNVLPGFHTVNIGQRNAEFVRSYLRGEGIALRCEDLGGQAPRRVHYFPVDGRAFVKCLPVAQKSSVAAEESRYIHRLKQEPAAGSVELF
ncbi:MAG TPA: chemoreceptor glutamine deamidase CheD [Fontimonas sp.]